MSIPKFLLSVKTFFFTKKKVFQKNRNLITFFAIKYLQMLSAYDRICPIKIREVYYARVAAY